MSWRRRSQISSWRRRTRTTSSLSTTKRRRTSSRFVAEQEAASHRAAEDRRPVEEIAICMEQLCCSPKISGKHITQGVAGRAMAVRSTMLDGHFSLLCPHDAMEVTPSSPVAIAAMTAISRRRHRGRAVGAAGRHRAWGGPRYDGVVAQDRASEMGDLMEPLARTSLRFRCLLLHLERHILCVPPADQLLHEKPQPPSQHLQQQQCE